MRTLNRLLAVVVAAVVGGAGFFVLIEATATAGGWGSVFPGVHVVPGYFRQHALGEGWPIAGAVAAVVLGAVLLVVQLRRRDRTRRVKTAVPQLHLAVTRRARTTRLAPEPSQGRPLAKGPRIHLDDGIDRVNRALLTLTGIALLAAGGLALTAAGGGFGARWRHDPVEDATVRGWLIANNSWLWWAVAAVALAGLLLALWWLLAQLTTRRSRRIQLGHNSQVAARPLLRALADELAGLPGVAESRLRLRHRRHGPQLLATVLAGEDADLHRLWQVLEHTVIPHARDASGHPELPIRLTLDQEPSDTETDERHEDHQDTERENTASEDTKPENTEPATRQYSDRAKRGHTPQHP